MESTLSYPNLIFSLHPTLGWHVIKLKIPHMRIQGPHCKKMLTEQLGRDHSCRDHRFVITDALNRKNLSRNAKIELDHKYQRYLSSTRVLKSRFLVGQCQVQNRRTKMICIQRESRRFMIVKNTSK